MKKKKIIIISLVVMLLVTSVITFSYAYWSMTNEQTTMNKLTSGCLSITLEGEDAINLSNAFPITDEEGMELVPYEFTITNTCDLFVSYNVSLEILKDSTLPIKYVRSMINKEEVKNLAVLETTTTNLDGSIDSKILTTGSLGVGDSTDYSLRIWMDEDVTINDTDAINKMLLSKVVVTAQPSSYSPVKYGFTLLNEALLVNEKQTTSLDLAKDKIANKQEVDTTKTAPIIDWQEYHSNEITEKTFAKADPSLIGNYGVEETTTQILFGSSYTFDATTGYYTLTERAYYNPEEIDFSAKDYYMCSTKVSATSDNQITDTDAKSCSQMSKIINLKSVAEGTLTLSGGDVVPTKRYTFNLNLYTEAELESDKSDKGLYQTTDDYGDSYYYRGNVTNNYVKFAGFYWQIIRLNGDGTIRLLYAGITPDSTGKDKGIDIKRFNITKSDATYVGYMYSNIIGSSYTEAIQNDNNSTIKSTLDNWYVTNILNNGYDSYIADSGFCNDRSIASDSPSDGNDPSSNIYYSGRYRITKSFAPSFICPNPTNDLFTLSGNNKGNGNLTYPIGLMTADEASYAGSVYGVLNSMVYICSGESFYTMTPYAYGASITTARMITISSSGNLYYSDVNTSRSVRPVINLKADTEITQGIGTKNDPFIIK